MGILGQKNQMIKPRVCGRGPTKFRLALMACGLNVTGASDYLDAPHETVLEWVQMGTAPAWAFGELRMLHARIVEDDVDLPSGSVDMADLLREWGVS